MVRMICDEVREAATPFFTFHRLIFRLIANKDAWVVIGPSHMRSKMSAGYQHGPGSHKGIKH